MTLGVGGSTIEAELGRMRSMREGVARIGDDELRARVAKAQSIMRREGIAALHLDSSTSCLYFAGLRFKLTERLHGVVIPAEGDPVYVSPAFEAERLRTMMRIPGEIRCWEEHESPTALVIDVVRDLGHPSGTIAVDPSTPFFTFDGLRRAGNSYSFVNGATVTAACRMIKSPAEIALIRHAMALTLEVHKATARISSSEPTPRPMSASCCSASRPPTRTACPIRRP